MTDPHAIRRRILWRATHRGTREMDLIVGGYVAAKLESLPDAELGEIEALLELNDSDIQSWINGEAAPPRGLNPFLPELLAFRP
jgi:antitoxin CptB